MQRNNNKKQVKSEKVENTGDGPKPKKTNTKRKFHRPNTPGGKGSWILKCDGTQLDENGKTEADRMLETLSNLHVELPELFKYEPGAYKPHGRDGVNILCHCSDHKDLKNVLRVMEEVLKRIDHPFVVLFLRKNKPLYLYTPEKELYGFSEGCDIGPNRCSYRFLLKFS